MLLKNGGLHTVKSICSSSKRSRSRMGSSSISSSRLNKLLLLVVYPEEEGRGKRREERFWFFLSSREVLKSGGPLGDVVFSKGPSTSSLLCNNNLH